MHVGLIKSATNYEYDTRQRNAPMIRAQATHPSHTPKTRARDFLQIVPRYWIFRFPIGTEHAHTWHPAHAHKLDSWILNIGA